MGTIVFLFVKNYNILKIDFFYQTAKGISVSEPAYFIIYYAVVFLIFLLPLFLGRRASCHYICWMSPFMIIGNKIRYTLETPSLRLKAEKEKCVQCKKCDVKCPMSLPVYEMVSHNQMNNLNCILCGECIDVCPAKLISYEWRSTAKWEEKEKQNT